MAELTENIYHFDGIVGNMLSLECLDSLLWPIEIQNENDSALRGTCECVHSYVFAIIIIKINQLNKQWRH